MPVLHLEAREAASDWCGHLFAIAFFVWTVPAFFLVSGYRNTISIITEMQGMPRASQEGTEVKARITVVTHRVRSS